MAYKWTNNAIATATSVASEDLILTVDDPSGTPVSKKITVANLIGSTDVISVIESNTNVTLAGSYDYLTISGQVITLGQIDLSTDVTGTLASGNIGSHTHVIADVTDFTDSSTNWNTAYGWGDHGTEGYLTSYTESDPVFVASDVYGVTTADIGTWDTAYGWGDHSTAGYSTSTGTVTSVATSGSVNGLTLTGGTITTSGTVTLGGTLAINNDDWSGTVLSAANGGTGLSSISTLLNSNVTPTSLGLLIGTNTQAWDADLDAIAALLKTDGNFIVGNGSAWVAESGATARASLGVDAAGTDNSTDVTLAGTYDYLTLSGQQITLGQIDLSTDVTGTLPSGNIGAHTHATSDITSGTFADARIAQSNVTQHQSALSITSSQISDKASANGVASLDGSGKVPSSQLSAIALSEVFVVSSQSAQLALTAQEGDVVVRTDESKSYIHNGGTAGTMADYTELQTPADAVTSVNGYTGTVSLTTSDVGEGTNLYYTSGRFDTAFSGKDTDDLAEGATNQYFTNSRSRSAISLTTTNSSELSYDSGTGVFSYVSPTTVADANSVTLEVRNTTGSTIPKGAAVYISGHNGNKILIDLADADASGKYPAIGLAAGAIANNSDGEVTVYGELAGVNTSSYSIGDVLYLSSTPGVLTNTRPTSSADAVQNIGRVARSDSNGIIIVSGSGRANDIPNLADTHVFIGGSSSNEQRALATADILSGTFADARISESSVTQHQAALSITESQISDLQSYITGITGEPLSDLSDATITAVASGEILKWSGSAWINNTLAEADIASAATLSSHAGSTANPHSVTATQVGLGNVENTALSTWSGSSNVTTVGETAVTAHEGALTITESQVSDLGNYVDAGTALVYSIIF
jgi:hypothetical protein